MATMKKRNHGDSMGCSDTGAPEKYSNAQLSRLYDALYNAQQASISPQDVFATAPDAMKLEFNYSRWTYVAE